MNTPALTRRTFLRGAGVAVGLPFLDGMALRSARAASGKVPDVRRLLAICSPLGIHTPYLFPEKAGKD